MKKYIFDNIVNVKTIIFSGLSAIGGFWLKDKYNKRKKITIEAEEIYNVSSLTGVPEFVNDPTMQYSNLIYNRVTVKTLNPEVISSIVLNKIKMEPNKLADIRYDGGLYVDQQKYLLIAYNNGNQSGETGNINITVSAIKKGTRDKVRLASFISTSSSLSPGAVIGQHKVDLLEYKDIFENNEEYVSLEILFEDLKNSIPKGGGVYNRDTGRFEARLGAGPGPSIQEVPFFNLSKATKKEERHCSQHVENISDIYFTVFVEESCVLSYTVELKSKSKKINSKYKHTIKIRIPKYKQEKTCVFGYFYLLIRDHNPDLLDFNYSLDTVKDLQKDLVFDKYEAAQKYAKVTFDV
ncbi:hypothetical protein V2U03_07430 [Streptococcus agalactiae]|uniref:hypothetical protein n=1 Tax=Streptococcus agalactiae TaxID=1311 RepID=UPI001374B80A|nr:hypothetical protein [Streptococcus agalactiae]KAF1154461.1 hypothetical protein B8V37_04490 [Streptococcus agalactiae]KAF1156832.1 hypothetical protein B8V18_06570 [Streptococcus agalactiae]